MPTSPSHDVKPALRGVFGCACLLLFLVSGCTGSPEGALPTLLPAEYVPTAIALTAQAASDVSAPAETSDLSTATPSPPSPTRTQPPPTERGTLQPSATASPTLAAGTQGRSPTPTRITPTLTPTPQPEIPFADIQIINLGPLSKVTSPIHLSVYLKSAEKGRILIELLGEDRRLLFREVKSVRGVPAGAWLPLKMEIDYEISAAAEAGRLQISVEDEKQRITALNSVPLILLSLGEADILPPQDLLAPIVIHKPARKTMIQGGTALVSGLVRDAADQFVMVRLLNPEGGEVGSRLASVEPSPEGDYGKFEVEVPYTITKPTPALLVVTLGENGVSEVIHVSSVEVLLGP